MLRGLTRRVRLARSFLRASIDLPRRLLGRYRSRRIQQAAIKQLGYRALDKIVIFFIPGIQQVTGGVLQIFTLHRLTREFYKDVATDCVICWIPGEGWDSHHFDGFNNEVTIFPLEAILRVCRPHCELMFHLPEYAALHLLKRIGWRRLARLKQKHNLKINILNQNIEKMLGPEQLERIKEVFRELTCTVGNAVWASESERQRLGIPLHVLPTWYYPDDAPWQPYESKKNLMIVSPDQDPYRDLVLDKLRTALPELEIRVIQGLKYEQYLELERSAKWSLTFGEGLDGYFYGPVLRGGVAFAVRNGTFDLLALEDLRTVYDNYEIMIEEIVECIRELDTKEAYEDYNRVLRTPLSRALGRERTSEALISFYRGELSFP